MSLVALLSGSFRTFWTGACRAATTTSTFAATRPRRLGSLVRLLFLFAITCTSWRGRTVSQETKRPEPFELSDEQLCLHRYRYRQARHAGMSMRDAKLFALEHSMDVGEMRALAKAGCPPDLMLLIL